MIKENHEGGAPVFDHAIGDTIFAWRGGGEGGDDTFTEGKRKRGVGGRGGAPGKGEGWTRSKSEEEVVVVGELSAYMGLIPRAGGTSKAVVPEARRTS
jgi:hypothetical protein